MSNEFKPTKLIWSEYVNFDETGHGKLTYVNVGGAYVIDEDLLTHPLHLIGNVVYSKELLGLENVEIVYYRMVDAKIIVFDRDKLMDQFKL